MTFDLFRSLHLLEINVLHIIILTNHAAKNQNNALHMSDKFILQKRTAFIIALKNVKQRFFCRKTSHTNKLWKISISSNRAKAISEGAQKEVNFIFQAKF